MAENQELMTGWISVKFGDVVKLSKARCSDPEDEELTGVIMADQLRSLDYKARKVEYAGDCPEMVVRDVLRRIKPIIF